MLRLLMEEKPITVADVRGCMKPSMKSTPEELYKSLDGVVTGLQRELIREILSVIDWQTKQISRLDQMIERYMDDRYWQVVQAIPALPGVAQVSARIIVAEIGVNMRRFPSADHLCSWAGISPGNNESAGKRKSGRTTSGNKALKSTIVQCAVVAAKDKNSYFHAQYQRLVVRRGKNRAIVAVAHSMLIAIYHVLSGRTFHDLGAGYYNTFNTQKKINAYLNKLKNLGWEPPAGISQA